jgi:hypothetical protein
MGKLYGGRWRTIGSQIGSGGRSEVYLVVDVRGEFGGENALRRGVRNSDCYERFKSETKRRIVFRDHFIGIDLVSRASGVADCCCRIAREANRRPSQRVELQNQDTLRSLVFELLSSKNA